MLKINKLGPWMYFKLRNLRIKVVHNYTLLSSSSFLETVFIVTAVIGLAVNYLVKI